MEKLRKLVTVVIVTYNSSRFIEKCLSTLKGYNVVVVDNDSKDNTLELVKKYKASIIANKDNVGYGAAANIAAKQLKTKYMLLLNPDIYFDKGAIEKMVTFMEKRPECDIMGPKLLDGNGNMTESCRRFPTFTAILGNRFGGLFKKSRDNYLMREYDHKELKKVDWVVGGCIIYKKEIMFDERYFLYLEDVDLCVGRNVYYNPKIYGYHLVQRDSAKKLRPLMFHITSFIKFKMKYMFKKISSN